MRLLIVHLSDLHIKEDTYFPEEKITNIVKTLVPVKNKYDKLMFVVSGDITFSGKVGQYHRFNYLKNFFIRKIKDVLSFNDYIPFYIVPGNHDLDYYSECRRNNDIEENFFKQKDKDLFNDDIKLLKNFYDYSKRLKCFSKNKILDIKFLNVNGIKIKINLLNSAIFSTLSNDKGLHYFPEEVINKLYLTDSEANEDIKVVISVMHHHYEWFHDCIKIKLEKALFSGTSLLLLGHEHNISVKNTELDKTDNLNIVGGGILFNNNKMYENSFNIIIIDSDKNNIETRKYVESKNNGIFIESDKLENELPYKRSNQYKLYQDEEFINSFIEDDKNTVSKKFVDYYVFPRLVSENNIKNKAMNQFAEVCDINDFNSLLLDKKFITIKGDDNSGKTAFLKYLYLYYKDKKDVMFFNAENLQSFNMNNFIENIFYQQYGHNNLNYAKFLQCEKIDKIAFVDNINLIKNKYLNKFLSKLKENFGYIVVSIKNEIDFDIYEQVRKELNNEDNFSTFRITNFYADKRKELINKVTMAYLKKDVEFKDLEKKTDKIYKTIKRQLEIFTINPDWIIRYTKCWLENEDMATNHKNVFSVIFDNNIINSLREQVSNENDLRAYLIVLEEIAYFIHKNHRYPLSVANLEEIIKKYNDEYDQVINSKRFLNSLMNAKIIKYTDDSLSLRFSDNNILAYFIAKRINRQFNNDRDNSDLLDILNNICFGINDNIILFLSYITQNKEILLKICDEAEEFTKDWPEFVLEPNNISYLNKVKKTFPISIPKAKEEKEILKLETESEKKKFSNKIETVNLYDYNENDLNLEINKLLKATKYAEIIAKALPNFRFSLPKNEQEKFIHNIYDLPNKIIFRILSYLDNDFDEFVEQLTNEVNNNLNKENIKLTKENIIGMFVNISLDFILALYYLTAKEANDKDNVKILSKYIDINNVNNYIQNCMMLEEVNDIETLQRQADKLLKNKNVLVTILIQRIIRKYLIYNIHIDDTTKRKLREKYFPGMDTSSKARLLLKQYKMKQKNK